MKINSKKLVVFVIIAALALFMAVTMTSAGDGDDHRKGIIGEYGFTGGGNCISNPIGNFDPIDPTKVSGSSYNVHGFLIFKKDGTGTIDFWSVGTPIAPAWTVTYSHATYPFIYTVTDDGEFTFAAAPNTFTSTYYNPFLPPTDATKLYSVIIDQYHLTGWVSADHKTIVVATPGPEIRIVSLPNGTQLQKLICHDSHVCTRLGEGESWPDRH